MAATTTSRSEQREKRESLINRYGGTAFVTDDGTDYHLGTCTRLADQVAQQDDVRELRADGYTACVTCRPDTSLARKARALDNAAGVVPPAPRIAPDLSGTAGVPAGRTVPQRPPARQAYAPPAGQPFRPAPLPVEPTSKKPLYRKKRLLIPVGLLVVSGIVGAVGGGGESSPSTTPTGNVAVAPPAAPVVVDPAVAAAEAEAKRVADAKAAKKAAADKAVADKAVADKAAAEKAAADKAAAKKAAADKAAAAKQAAADKAAAEQAAAEKAAAEAEARRTTGQRNAVSQAESYLGYTAFSRTGLIEQLEFEGFSKADATYAVGHVTVDWNEQAVKQAESYLDYTAFSRASLIEQLEFEGFTHSQAVYGASKNGY